MNSRYKNNPELIAGCRTIDDNSDDKLIGDKVTGIAVKTGENWPTPVVQIDIRNFKGNTNLIIEIELSELVAALSLATLHAED